MNMGIAWRSPFLATTKRSLKKSSAFAMTTSTNNNRLFLHVGPSGDCWTGSSLFAAKHLQPDYVRSIALPEGLSLNDLLLELEGDIRLAQEVYDRGAIPESLLQRVAINPVNNDEVMAEGTKDEK